MIMDAMLENIIKKCYDNNLNVLIEDKDGKLAVRVKGFSKSGSALIYVDGDEIICETRYGQKDHLLTFDDLVLVAKSWYENYRDRATFEHPEEEWFPLLEKIYDCNDIEDGRRCLSDNLPF